MPGPGAEAANRNAATSAALFTPVTTPEQDAGTETFQPERQQNCTNDENPFYPEVVDAESVSTDLSEHRKTFADRLKHLIRRLRKTGEDDGDFTYDFEVEQIVKSLDHFIVGYPKIAALAATDPSFLIYRKFGWLHNRLLLYLQDEIVALEYKLNKLDQRTFSHDNEIKLKSRREDFNNPGLRQDTIKQITEKLKEYDEHLLRFQKIQAIRRPTVRNQTSLYNFIHQTRGLVDSESKWIREGADLAAVAREEEHGWFNGFLEDTLHKISPRATQAIFRTNEQKIATGQERVFLISPFRLDVFLRVVLTILAAVLLLLPVVILFELQPTKASQIRRNGGFQILTIFLFTLLFSASCSIFTKARRQEVFTATAAYSAVLVVFLGSTLNTCGGS
ncbi:MAG: hypothetical protein LQ349_008215 [Xanthoria aureola]|nr:MAG: hypothetical protein LQ349_008215 [Xanthoria aureola]